MKRHQLTEVDYESGTAVCSICGPTLMWVPSNRSSRTCLARYEEILLNNRDWRHAKAEREGKTLAVRHIVSNVNPELRMGDCIYCGSVEVKRRVDKGTVRWECITVYTRHRENSVSTTAGHGLSRGEATRFVKAVGKCQNPGCGKLLEGSGASYDGGQVDHDHATDVIRGVLCGRCNLMAGSAGDSIEVLAGLIEYLKNPPGYLPPTE